MLVEFWDFCRPNSLRTLPYLKAWHERYAADGLRIIGVHSPGFEPGREEQAVRDAVARLGVEYPVLIDRELTVWREYENEGWPARYLFDGRARLFEYHFGEGAYAETELAIQELLGVQREPVEPVRPEDVPGAQLVPQTQDQEGAYSGPYEAGGVWAVLDGLGTVRVERQRAGRHPPRRLCADRARASHRRGAGSGDRPGRALLRDVLHAGLGVAPASGPGAAASSACERSSSRRSRTGWAVIVDDHALPGQ